MQVALNPVLWSVFFVMGVISLIFAALMVPSARSQNKVSSSAHWHG
jgi:hypothetical protein